MIRVLQGILENTLARLGEHLTMYVPPLLVAVVIFLTAWTVAMMVRWLILRVVKAISFDRFLRESGLSSLLGAAGQMRGASIVAGTAYWVILGVGLLTALDAFNTKLTTQIIESTVFLLPKLLTAGAILLAGFWLAQYLSRSVLIWAVNEELPFARRLGAVAKVTIGFVAVVVASDVLGFASQVFFAAFVIFAGSVALACGLAAGLGLRESVGRFVSQQGQREQEGSEKSLWHHL